MKKKPRKPTEPFGHMSFGKDKTVQKRMFQLSPEKGIQEKEVIERFVEGIRRVQPNLHIHGIEQLPEADQDFIIRTSLGPVIIQLTELVERDYTKPISKDEYNSSRYHHFIIKQSGQIPWAVDDEGRDSALIRTIQRKLAKNYSKSNPDEKLWLVIFSTSLYFMTEYYEGGIRQKSKALIAAQEFLRMIPKCVFDQIWYYNLQTNPECIYPGS